MIDFTETPVKEAPSQRRRRRKSKKKVQFSTREILDDKENTVRVETITPLKKNVPTPTGRRLVRRLARASTGLFGTRAAPAPEPRAAPTADAVASTSSPPPSDAAPEARRVEEKEEEEEEEALEIEDVAQPSSTQTNSAQDGMPQKGRTVQSQDSAVGRISDGVIAQVAPSDTVAQIRYELVQAEKRRQKAEQALKAAVARAAAIQLESAEAIRCASLLPAICHLPR